MRKPILQFLMALAIIFCTSHAFTYNTTRELTRPTQQFRADSLRVGDEAPTFVLREAFSDEPIFLRDYTGVTLRQPWKNSERNVVVLSFWASWCEPCKEEIPLLTSLAEEFKKDPVQVFLVNTKESPEFTEDSLRGLIKKRGYTLPTLIDATGTVAQRYSVWGLPMLVVIDKYGLVRKINRGYQKDFEHDVTKLIRGLLKEEKSATEPGSR